jgi:hypothetical protein
MSKSVYFPSSREECFALWKDQVRGIVEADDFARHILWERFSKEYAEMFPKLVEPRHVRVEWEQGNPGYLHTIPGKHFSTSVQLNVDRLDGKLCLFWTCTSTMCDWNAAEAWVRENFPSAVDSSDATNFVNVVHTLKRL